VLSSSADAFHVLGLPRGPTIQSSTLEGHNDDGIAIHGVYSLVVDVSEKTSTNPQAGRRTRHDHDSSAPGQEFEIWVAMPGEYAPGNILRVYDRNFTRSEGLLRVLSVAPASPTGNYTPPQNHSHTMPHKPLPPEPHARYSLLTVVPADPAFPPPAEFGFDFVVFNQDRGSAGYLLRNNTIRNHRARGMLVKASNGIIEHNRIDNSSLGGIIITPELYWGEGDYVSNVTVRNNNVTNVCTGKQCYGGLALGAKLPDGQGFAGGTPYGHSDVHIVGNRFRNISQMNIWVSSATNSSIQGNIIDAPYAYPSVATCCPPFPYPKGVISWLTESSNITVKGNCVRGAPPGIPLLNLTPSVLNSAVEMFREC